MRRAYLWHEAVSLKWTTSRMPKWRNRVPRYTIDRFEGVGWAVLEDEHGQTFTVPRDWLPSTAREGDALKGDATAQTTAATIVRFELDPTAREEQLAKASARRDALPRGPKGDISL